MSYILHSYIQSYIHTPEITNRSDGHLCYKIKKQTTAMFSLIYLLFVLIPLKNHVPASASVLGSFRRSDIDLLLSIDTTTNYKFQSNYKIRIVGGIQVKDSVPYQVSIQKLQSRLPFCGGAIISKRFIITAAHCVQG